MTFPDTTAPPLPRAALVTGVGRRRGIGAAIARGLAADGFDLALSYSDAYDRRVNGEGADVELLADELREQGRRIELVTGDLADPAEPPRIVEAARATLGPLGVLVMCHCESVDSSILDTTVESFDRHYAVNVRASWLLEKAFAEQVEWGTQTPGGRLGEPSTVADLVRFLVSDRGAWIRGLLLLSNGGFATPAV